MKLGSAISRVVATSIFLGLSGQTLAQPTPDSPEYRMNTGLGTINVYPAWEDTTGEGVVVASLDTGVNTSHFEMIGRIAPGGAAGDVDRDGGHGTSLAGVIASNFNNAGTVGVAYNSQVLPIGIADSNRFAGPGSAALGFNIASSRADVRIISFTVGTVFSEPLNSAIINAINVGKTVFIRSGNDFQNNPDVPASVYNQFNGGGLIIGAYNPNTGTIADLSNKAGAAANVYLAAPGVGITGPGNRSNDSFVTWTGSSIATSHAAGVAALLLAQNPNLSPQEIIQIMVDSATDIGAPGVDDVTGLGLLNAAEAVNAQGGLDSSSGAAGAAVALAAVAVGGGLAYFWSQNKKAKDALSETLVFDAYDRPYIMNMNDMLHTRNTAPTLFDAMDMFDRQTRAVDYQLSDNLALTLHTRTANPSDYVFLKDSDPFLEDYEHLRQEDFSVKMAASFNNGISLNMNHNYAPTNGFDTIGDMSLSENFLTANAFGGQYFGFGSLSDSVNVGYRANSKLSFQLGANRLDDNQQYGQTSTGTILQGNYTPTEKSAISLRMSNVYEEGSLLGGSSGGVFSVSHANTTALGLTGQYKVFDKFSLFASYTQGFTGVKEQEGSFMQGFSGLLSQSWGAGVMGNSLFSYRDSAGFAISSPLHVSNGDVDLVIPHSLDSARNIQTSRTRVSLSPDQREIDLEAFYRMKLSHRTQLGTTLTYRDTPGDADYIGKGLSVFTTVGMVF